MPCPLTARPPGTSSPRTRNTALLRATECPNKQTTRSSAGADTDAVLADAMAEQADVRRLTGTHTHAEKRVL
jgi:hypothetical protein